MTETTEPQPTEATVTVASQSIELLLTGKPDVRYKWGSGSIRPGIVVFTYRQDGIHAHLYGVWVREDGELTDDPCDQEYRIGGPDDWPDWLAELAREHKPADGAPVADRAALRDRIVTALATCQGGTTWGAMADAVLAALPAPTVASAPVDRAAILREQAEVVEAMNEGCGQRKPCASCDAREDVADHLRRRADEAQQPEAEAFVCKCPAELCHCRHHAAVSQPAVGAQQPKEA
jgi:hypothetical protein